MTSSTSTKATNMPAGLFPDGMRPLGDVVRHLGLTFGLWTAPFEVSERAWVYHNHPDWLVHNASGKPIFSRKTEVIMRPRHNHGMIATESASPDCGCPSTS